MAGEGSEAAARGCARPGCWVRGPLGCLAFVIGLAVVLVFLGPGVIGRFARAGITEQFAQEHQGSLACGEMRLAWFSEQRVDGLILRDPDGAYVAAAGLSLPPLADVFDRAAGGEVGPIVVDLDARLERRADGAWNLERALERRPTAGPETSVRVALGDPDSRAVNEVDLRLAVRRWRVQVSAPELEALGRREVVLDLDRGEALISGVRPSSVRASGTLDGGARVEVELGFSDLGLLLSGRERPRAWSVAADGAPADLLALILPRGLPYAAAFGERVGSARVARDAASGRVAVELRGAAARMDLSGVLEQGVLRSAPAADAGAALASHLAFELGGFLGVEALPRLLPFLEVRPAGEGLARVEVVAFAIPCGGDLSGVELDLEVQLGQVAYALFPRRAGDAGWTGLASDGALALPPIAVRIEGATARLDDVPVPLSGETVRISGTVDLATGALDLTARGPASALAPLAGAAEGREEAVVRVLGTAAAPEYRSQ